MQQIEFANALGQIYVSVPQPTDHHLDELAIDYCRIFIGPKNHAPPFQSVWTDGQLNSECVTSMAEYLEIVNRDPEDFGIKDHFGVQLSVMASILTAASQSEEEQEIERLSRAFFLEHIDWAPKMIAAAGRRAETEFYQTMLQATHDFVVEEKAVLEL